MVLIERTMFNVVFMLTERSDHRQAVCYWLLNQTRWHISFKDTKETRGPVWRIATVFLRCGVGIGRRRHHQSVNSLNILFPKPFCSFEFMKVFVRSRGGGSLVVLPRAAMHSPLNKVICFALCLWKSRDKKCRQFKSAHSQKKMETLLLWSATKCKNNMGCEGFFSAK